MAGNAVYRGAAARVRSGRAGAGVGSDNIPTEKFDRRAEELKAHHRAALVREAAGSEGCSPALSSSDAPLQDAPLQDAQMALQGSPDSGPSAATNPRLSDQARADPGAVDPDGTPASTPAPTPTSAPASASASTQPHARSDTQASSAFDDYEPVKLSRMRPGGWTAERQRKFLVTLAETGSVSEASIMSGVSARSAYRLRQRPHATAFADAWDHALKLASLRLVTLAFERATTGTVREIWREGRLVGTTRAPSEKLLMFLIRHLMPAPRAAQSPEAFQAEIEAARAGFPCTLDALRDDDVEIVPIQSRDFFPPCPGDPRDDW